MISVAYAQSSSGGFSSDVLLQFLPLILIFLVFYFLLIRPQSKKQKEHKQMLDEISRGDQIVTMGGLLGQVVKVHENAEILLKIAENVEVVVKKDFVANVLSKSNESSKK